jgi:hypothetical protein
MAKAKATKVPPIKKVVVTSGITNLTPDEKVAYQRTTANTCKGSAAFTASAPCQASMTTWATAANNLELNQQQKEALLVQLAALEQAEATCLFAYDEAADNFAASVRTAAAGNAAIVTGMGLGTRADPVRKPDPFTPTGLTISMLKGKKVPKLEWADMSGAVLYTAQMTTTPAVDASWVVIYGSGKSRLPVLVPGQTYSFRVAAVGKDGKQSAWSATVQFTA